MEDAFAPGAVAKRVAERHEIGTGLLFTWRRQLTVNASAGFVLVQLISDTAETASAPSDAPARLNGLIEIEMRSGARVRIGQGPDLEVLRGVLTILDGR